MVGNRVKSKAGFCQRICGHNRDMSQRPHAEAGDRLVRQPEVPIPSDESLFRLLLADGHNLFLAFACEHSGEEKICLLEFQGYRLQTFGPPSQQALMGQMGFGTFEIRHSVLLGRFEEINALRAEEDREDTSGLRHFSVFFTDSTFECVALSVQSSILPASSAAALEAVQARLWSV